MTSKSEANINIENDCLIPSAAPCNSKIGRNVKKAIGTWKRHRAQRTEPCSEDMSYWEVQSKCVAL